jgi:two-component system NtrC family sensor kinase
MIFVNYSPKKKLIRCYIAIVFLLGFSFAYPQDKLPDFILLTSDTVTILKPAFAFYQVLSDPGGKYNVNEVSRAPLSNSFQSYAADTPDIRKNEDKVFWTRFQLRNNSSQTINVTLQENQDEFDVYIKASDTGWTHFRSGHLIPRKEKDGFTAFNAIPISLQPGVITTVYTRQLLGNKPYYPKPLQLYSTTSFITDQYVSKVEKQGPVFHFGHLSEAFIIGVLLITIMFNIYFYKVVREKLYLYFALAILFLAVNRHYNIIGEYTRLEYPQFRWILGTISIAWLFIYAFLILFFREAFKTKTFLPRWDKYLLAILFVHITAYTGFLLLGNIQLTRYIFGWTLIIMNNPVIPLSLFITTLFYSRSNDQFYRLLVIAAFPLLIFYGVIGLFTDNKSWFGEHENLPSIIKWFVSNFRSVEILCLIWFVLFFTWLLFVRFDKLRKENAQRQLDFERVAKEREIEKNELISKQKVQLELEVAERTADLKASLENLKATQSQLVQAEKMASLGEVTAGIAHEIQNPLNFVNNFSDVNKELIDELMTEAGVGNIEEIKYIAADIKANEEKINHHGKRADMIVKGMLQHSRVGRGEKEPTDINELADEYLRIAYHGINTKDDTFNAELLTNYDNNIGKINIVPQDISRVLLNLFNNALYSLNEKRKLSTGFIPKVSVSTSKKNDIAVIAVEDNGDGIPENVVDKIFQPFFTTKPTGKGTGLGLSLAYDIVKAHGGNITVENSPGKGVKFIITLPLS